MQPWTSCTYIVPPLYVRTLPAHCVRTDSVPTAACPRHSTAHPGNAAVFAKLGAFSLAMLVLPLVTYFAVSMAVVPGVCAPLTIGRGCWLPRAASRPHGVLPHAQRSWARHTRTPRSSGACDVVVVPEPVFGSWHSLTPDWRSVLRFPTSGLAAVGVVNCVVAAYVWSAWHEDDAADTDDGTTSATPANANKKKQT